MCLDRVIYTGSEANERADTAIGFKIFGRKKNGHLKGQHYTDTLTRPHNKWLHEKDFRSTCDLYTRDNSISVLKHGFNIVTGSFDITTEPYPAGWHVYTSLVIASVSPRFIIRRVKMKDIVTIGEQYQLNAGMSIVYVCKQIKILKEP